MADAEEAAEEVVAEAIEDNEQAEKEVVEATVDQEEAAAEDASDEAEADPFELLDEDSEDTEEQELMYREYIDLTKQIDCQNGIISDIKAHINKLRELPCPTRSEIKECKRLRICLDQENIKLHSMTNRAIKLQNCGSKRLYSDVELATTGYDENLFDMSAGCRNKIKSPSKKKRTLTAQEICDALDSPDSDSDDCCPRKK